MLTACDYSPSLNMQYCYSNYMTLIPYAVSAICKVFFLFHRTKSLQIQGGKKVRFQELVYWSNLERVLFTTVTESANVFSQDLQTPPVLKEKVLLYVVSFDGTKNINKQKC